MDEKCIMQLVLRTLCAINNGIKYKNNILVLLLSVLVMACDSDDALPVRHVDDTDRMSDSELVQFHNSKKSMGLPNTYSFGFNLRASPQEDTAQYLPFLNYLENATGYHFKLHFTPKGSFAADELGENKIQFAAIGATSYLYAESRYGVKLLVRGLNAMGKAQYQSVFIVRPDSDIKDINDFKGKMLAFGSNDSTQGHLIPRIMLARSGIPLDDFKSFGYTGSHQRCAESVISGSYDICGMQDQLAKKLASEGQVKIIHYSRYYPSSGIVANHTVAADVVERVRQALLDFQPLGKDAKGLYHWEKTEMAQGFVSAPESDYNNLREWSFKLGFLQQPEESSMQ